MRNGTQCIRAPTSGTVLLRRPSPCSAPMPVLNPIGSLRRALLSLVVLAAMPSAFAQTVRDIPRASSDIVVDGVLDDAAWANATPIS